MINKMEKAYNKMLDFLNRDGLFSIEYETKIYSNFGKEYEFTFDINLRSDTENPEELFVGNIKNEALTLYCIENEENFQFDKGERILGFVSEILRAKKVSDWAGV